MTICSRMWDQDGILTKLVAIVAHVNISLPWGVIGTGVITNYNDIARMNL